MAKYDYIKVRVNEEERAQLEKMVEDGQASTLSDAVRKMAFAPKLDKTELVTKYLTEISTAHGEITKLIYNQLENRALHEPDIMEMERELARLSKSAAKFVRAMRKVM